MIDIEHISKYKENNRIEAKKARGGLPKSIWETYSAFANTLGGVILLGVQELTDKSLMTINLAQPEAMVEEFWTILNDTRKVSGNVLTRGDVVIHEIGGDRIIAITVPRADRRERPVYIGDSPFTGAYRRDGEGDYHCTREEIELMYRDSAEQSQDMKILEHVDMEVLDSDSIALYRHCMKKECPGHVWEQAGVEEFLQKAGAAGMGEDAALHPTSAGLLMFGEYAAVKKEYPQFKLACNSDEAIEVWEENLFQFYGLMKEKLAILLGGDNDVYTAVCEALANSLIHADYHGAGGIELLFEETEIAISNPGYFRIDVNRAINGGLSDPRNEAVLNLFHLINIGKREGSGIPGIYAVWAKRRWKPPCIIEQYHPDRIKLKLSVGEPQGVLFSVLNRGAEHPGQKRQQRELIVDIFTMQISVSVRELVRISGFSLPTVQEIVNELLAEDFLVEEETRKKWYKLKV